MFTFSTKEKKNWHPIYIVFFFWQEPEDYIHSMQIIVAVFHSSHQQRSPYNN